MVGSDMIREANETRDRVNADLLTRVNHRFRVVHKDGKIILSRLDDALGTTEEEFGIIENKKFQN